VIQRGLDAPWPDAVKEAVVPFRQGQLVERPPLFYAARLQYGVWSPTRNLAEADDDEGDPDTLVDLEFDQRPPFGIVTSQTCDVAEERPDPVEPWIQVAPVYQCGEGDPLLERDFVAQLDPPDMKGDGWIADLRIEMAMEKSLLVGANPIEAFPTEDEYDSFGDLLAYRRGRPALHSVFNEVVNVVTREMKQESKKNKKWARRVRETIYKLKLAIQNGSRLHPVAARLYVATRGEPTDETRAWFDEWWNRARLVAQEHDLELLPIGWLNTEQLEMDLERYDRLIDVRNPLWF
jgi:hypothetical protein